MYKEYHPNTTEKTESWEYHVGHPESQIPEKRSLRLWHDSKNLVGIADKISSISIEDSCASVQIRSEIPKHLGKIEVRSRNQVIRREDLNPKDEFDLYTLLAGMKISHREVEIPGH